MTRGSCGAKAPSQPRAQRNKSLKSETRAKTPNTCLFIQIEAEPHVSAHSPNSQATRKERNGDKPCKSHHGTGAHGEDGKILF